MDDEEEVMRIDGKDLKDHIVQMIPVNYI